MARHFEFRTDEAGNLTKDPPSPWRVGMRGDEVTIRLDNRLNSQEHRVRMVHIKHRGSGRFDDPLTGPKQWVAVGNQVSRETRHRVKDEAADGVYDFVTELDGVEGADPEIIVDRPPEEVPPKLQPQPQRQKAQKAKAVKKTKSAKKAKKAKKAQKAKKAKKAKKARAASRSAKRATKRGGKRKR